MDQDMRRRFEFFGDRNFEAAGRLDTGSGVWAPRLAVCLFDAIEDGLSLGFWMTSR
jgi:hypothetical protein